MNSNSSGKKLEGFFTGKGFYIVLFLCAAVIGVSAWMMVAGNETMAEDVTNTSSVKLDNQRVETVIIPPQKEELPAAQAAMGELDEEAPVIRDSGLAEPALQAEEEMAQALNGNEAEPAAVEYVWPVSGELERGHSTEVLRFDETMQDWRTHSGVDILAPVGTVVTAARAGTVEQIDDDDLYGTVVTIDHGDGLKTVYANLDAALAVSVGEWVDAGSVIGAVGGTALCEVAQKDHLHFAITVNGVAADPMNYLPA